MYRFSWCCLLMALVGFSSFSFAEEQGKDKSANWPPKVFPITFWCGPPEPYINVEQYRAIADAGFTVVMPPCEGEATVPRNRKILDLAAKTGLKAIISDARMPLTLTNNPVGKKALNDIVNDYRKSTALMGYFLTDEPGANRFADLSEVVAELHRLDPDRMVYINLLPNYASSDLNANPSQLNSLTYGQYLSRYMEVVKPDVLSWDHYHFLKDGDRPGFFGNLAAGQRAARSTVPPTPFWQIVLSVQHGSYRALTEGELRFEAMQTLAYGGHGLVYFTYWQPNDPSFQWSNAIRNRDGSPGPLYAAVKAVNSEVKALGTYLFEAQVEETFQSGAHMPPDGAAASDDSIVKVSGDSDLTVGTFRGAKGYIYLLVTNRDYKSGGKGQLTVNTLKHPVEKLDLKTGKWSLWAGKPTADAVTGDVVLDPGAAALLRWQ
jgi:hypothetical protein